MKPKPTKEWTDEKVRGHFEYLLRDVEENGIQARGKKEYIMFLQGKVLTMKQSHLASCYGCSGYYEGMGNDKDCRNPVCPTYFHMPYRNKKKDHQQRPQRTMTTEHKERMRLGREAKRLQ